MAISAEELRERIRTATGLRMTFVAAGGNRYAVRGESSAKWLLGKKSVTLDAIIKLDEASSTVTYWEMLTESSSGLAGGFFMNKYSQQGATRAESGSGTLPSGESYQYDLGLYRERVRAIAEEAGWQFKKVLMKPKD